MSKRLFESIKDEQSDEHVHNKHRTKRCRKELTNQTITTAQDILAQKAIRDPCNQVITTSQLLLHLSLFLQCKDLISIRGVCSFTNFALHILVLKLLIGQ